MFVKSTYVMAAVLVYFWASYAWAAPDCGVILPSDDAGKNYTAIMNCLSSSPKAVILSEGTFEINKRIQMPAGSKLTGAAGEQRPKIIAAPGFDGNAIVVLGDDNVVSDVNLDGDSQLKTSCCTAVASFSGSRSLLQNVDIRDGDVLADIPYNHDPKNRPAGLYFIGASSVNNTADKITLHDTYLGVVFRKGLKAGSNNTLSNSEIYRLACDSVSFAGYGKIKGNFIHDTGFDCRQKPTPIPGGGLYALNNDSGASIINNRMSNICGAAIDIVQSKHFSIKGNHITRKGDAMRKQYPYCVGGDDAKLVDVSHFNIDGNVFYISDVAPMGDTFKFFPSYAKQVKRLYAPLPDAEMQTVAVRLLRIKTGLTDNRLTNNRIIALCSPQAKCRGHAIGLFFGPGAGYDKAGHVSPNTATGNTIIGSTLAMVACGNEEFAGNSYCTQSTSDGNCAPGTIDNSAAQIGICH